MTFCAVPEGKRFARGRLYASAENVKGWGAMLDRFVAWGEAGRRRDGGSMNDFDRGREWKVWSRVEWRKGGSVLHALSRVYRETAGKWTLC